MAKTDLYAQTAYIDVTESAANTLTFAGLSVFSNILSNQGMIIHKIEYHVPAGTWNNLIAVNDAINFGITGDNTLTAISMADPAVYDGHTVYRYDAGAPVDNPIIYKSPVVAEFWSLPSGGMLVPADRLFGYVLGSNLAAVNIVRMRVWFTLVTLEASDYLELAQAMRVLR